MFKTKKIKIYKDGFYIFKIQICYFLNCKDYKNSYYYNHITTILFFHNFPKKNPFFKKMEKIKQKVDYYNSIHNNFLSSFLEDFKKYLLKNKYSYIIEDL